jgi:transcriptional regulator with XRE-family HTH domain
MNKRRGPLVDSLEGKDYVVQVRVKNGPLLRAMRRAGHYTAASLSRAAEVDQQSLGKLLNLTRPAIDRRTGEWTSSVMKIAECLGVMPANLFPPQHLEVALKKNTGEVEMSLDEVRALPQSLKQAIEHHTPEDDLIESDVQAALKNALSNLTEREQRVLNLRFGLDGPELTTKEVAEREGISSARAWQIEKRALIKMKSPTITSPVIEAGYQPTGSPRHAGDKGWRPKRIESAMPAAVVIPRKDRGYCPCGVCEDSAPPYARQRAIDRLVNLRDGRTMEIKVVPKRSTK